MSRKVTKEIVAAFLSRKARTIGNSMTDGNALFLHGNKIAYHTVGGNIFIRTAGWQSNTTKERLNGLPNVSITQRDYVWYLNGTEWDGNDVSLDALTQRARSESTTLKHL